MKRTILILSTLMTLSLSEMGQDWRSKPIDESTLKDVDRMLTDPHVVALPKLYRVYMVKQLLPQTTGQKLWDTVDAAERRADRKLNQPGTMYLYLHWKE